MTDAVNPADLSTGAHAGAGSVDDLVRWAEALSSIARTGLAFSDNLYDRERYDEILHVAGDILGRVHGGSQVSEHVELWQGLVTPGPAGYVTPKVGVGAFVGNEHGELLLIQRSDNHKWFVPTGWCDVGYAAAEVVEKELAEEVGLPVVVERLVAVLHGLVPAAHYLLAFSCTTSSRDFTPHPLEVVDVGWFAQDRLPEPLLMGGRTWVELAFASLRDELTHPYFDPPRPAVWNGAPPLPLEDRTDQAGS